MGLRLGEGLKEIQRSFPDVIKEVRGVGLMVGMELYEEGAPVVHECMTAGVLINCTMDRVLRFLPPLTVTDEEVLLLLKTLREVFRQTALRKQ